MSRQNHPANGARTSSPKDGSATPRLAIVNDATLHGTGRQTRLTVPSVIGPLDQIRQLICIDQATGDVSIPQPLWTAMVIQNSENHEQPVGVRLSGERSTGGGVSAKNQSTKTPIKTADERARSMRLTCKKCKLSVTVQAGKAPHTWPTHRCGMIRLPQEFTSGQEVTVVRVRSPLGSELRDQVVQGQGDPK
jgi:hypothetical protein